MLHHISTASLPRIVVAESEEYRLNALATAAAVNGNAEVGRALLAELERADVVRGVDVPRDVVRMYSRVEFQIDGGTRRSVQLVYPVDADIDAGRISVLTPIGAALIGLTPGQTMSLKGHDGRAHRLAVLSVTPGDA